MKRLKELRKKLGTDYVFKKFLSQREIFRIQEQNPNHFADTIAASLIVGCVKIEAVLFKTYSGLHLGYDVFVKDDPDSPEWICYDSPNDTVSIKELDMFSVLDKVVEKNNLSYTECCFERLDGKCIKTNKKSRKYTAM